MKRTVKRIASVIAACGLMLTALPVSADDSNTFTDKVITYEKTGSMTVKVTACTNVTTSVKIPGEIDGYKVTAIAEKAFAECENLKEVILPDSITDMGEGVFYGCTALEKVRFSDGIEEVPENTFCYCTSLKDVELPESVKTISSYAFAYCISLDEFRLPPTIGTIKSSAFYCSQLSDDFVIPDVVTHLESTAFYSCAGMETVTLPKNLETIEPYAFFACEDLRGFKTAEGCKYTAEDGILYNSDKTELICCPPGKVVENFTVPDTVKKIGDGAFFANTSLKTIDFGSVTSIGEGAFSNCTALEKLEFPNTVTEIPSNGFTDCESLWSVTIPEGVKKIADYAFYNCKRLKSIELPDSVKEVGKYALGYYEEETNGADGEQKEPVRIDGFEIIGGDHAEFAEPNPRGDGNPLALILYIALPIAAVSALVIFLLVKFRRGDKGSEDETDYEDDDKSGENDKEEDDEEEE